MQNQQNELVIQQIKKITWIGVYVNLALTAIKFWVGILGRSQAVVADAVHSLSDLTTDFAVIFGVKFWSAPPDQNHPYGHRRIEALITTTIGLLLASVAVGLGYNSLTTIREVHYQQTTWIAITGPVLSIIFKELLFRWTVIVGKRVQSSAVVANAWHHRSDALSSLPALVAVAVASINPDWAFVDHIGALIISVFILKVSWDIIRPSLAELTDQGASEKDQQLIMELVFRIEGVKDAHAIRTRKFGSSIAIDLHVLVDPNMSVRDGHTISEQVKDELMAHGPDVLDVVVHIEPFE
ncbi:cation transporter [candidate division KSB1 bacterium]|nr:cation transporter [candidate division KSB1 bacterium]